MFPSTSEGQSPIARSMTFFIFMSVPLHFNSQLILTSQNPEQDLCLTLCLFHLALLTWHRKVLLYFIPASIDWKSSLSLFFLSHQGVQILFVCFFWLVGWFFCLLVFHTNNQVFLLSDESGITGLFATYVHRATEVNKTIPCNVIGGEELILAKWIMIRNGVLTSVSPVFRSQNTHCI